MKGTLLSILPRASSTKPTGSVSTSLNVLSSTAVISLVKPASERPMPSFWLQRFKDATQSSAVTGVSSCQSRPSRGAKVHNKPSALDRKRVEEGKGVSVRVDLGGRR